MKIQKVVGIILLSIGICLIAFGGYKLFLEPKPEKDSKNENQITEDNKQDEVDKILNIKRNPSENLAKTKCLDSLCIENLTVFQQDGIYYITADIKNTSNQIIEDKYITLVFTDKNSNQTKSIYYIKRINQQSNIPYEAQFAENKDILLTVTDYYVEESTEADKNTITIGD